LVLGRLALSRLAAPLARRGTRYLPSIGKWKAEAFRYILLRVACNTADAAKAARPKDEIFRHNNGGKTHLFIHDRLYL
jgi:hypothetical protein